MLGAVVVAAGSSRRMGFDKLAADLAGIPVLARSLLAMQQTEPVTAIVVVARPESFDWIEQLAKEHSIWKFKMSVAGGEHRQHSVLAGLRALRNLSSETEWAAVHDGARPLVRPGRIADCFREACLHGSGCLAAPVTDTLKRVDETLTVLETVDRTALWAMQTPQIFRLQELMEAYEAIIRAGAVVTDEAAAMEAAGHQVHLVANPSINAKITYKQDLKLAELWLQSVA